MPGQLHCVAGNRKRMVTCFIRRPRFGIRFKQVWRQGISLATKEGISLFVAGSRPYARGMKTQFALWLGMIVSGLAFMTIVSLSGR